MAFAAATNASNVFPVAGALIELRKKGIGINDILKARVATRKRPTYPTIPAPQCFAILQKNQMATVVVWFNNGPTNICFLFAYAVDRL